MLWMCFSAVTYVSDAFGAVCDDIRRTASDGFWDVILGVFGNVSELLLCSGCVFVR